MKSLWLALLAVSCASPTGSVRPDEMGASAHEQEAAREERAAAWHARLYDPKAGRPCVQTVAVPAGPPGTPCFSNIANPTAEHLRAAEEHRRHAAEHRAASKVLRDTEARACVGVAEEDRDLSPFFHREDVIRVESLRTEAAVPVGARVVFRPIPGMTVEWLQRIVDCHLARNALLGTEAPEMDYCPLVLHNVTARVVQVWDGLAIDVRSNDPGVAVSILARVNTLVP
jgi:hypothetical protein